MDSKINKRNSNIEFLRIIAMMLIIAFHATRNAIFSSNQSLITYTSGVVFGSWGILGVDLFLIISAWFLSSQKFRVKKIIYIVFQTFTWVIAYTFIYAIYELIYIKKSVFEFLFDFFYYTLIALFQPLWSEYYWFITAFIFMMLISPFLNKILNNLNKEYIKKILIVFSFVPIYAQYGSMVGNVMFFLYVYLLVGFIKRYGIVYLAKYAKTRSYMVLIL